MRLACAGTGLGPRSGIILPVGLVKKNGIMVIDFALTRQRAAMSAEDAIVEASLVRLRPS